MDEFPKYEVSENEKTFMTFAYSFTPFCVVGMYIKMASSIYVQNKPSNEKHVFYYPYQRDSHIVWYATASIAY